jgi:hypothetical protein
MTAAVADIPKDAVQRRIVSPAFTMAYPEVWHADRIPPDVLRVVEHRWKQSQFPPGEVTISLLNNVVVASEGLVFTSTLDVLRPSIAGFNTDSIDRSRSAVATGLKAGSMPNIKGTVVLCKKRGARNYGHWIMEMLPKAFLARRACSYPISYMIQSTADPLSSVMRQSLSRINIEQTELVEVDDGPVHVEQLLMVDGLTRHGSYMSPLVMECIDALSAGIQPEGATHLLVLRSGQRSRHFIDEAEILTMATRQGYLLADPASMPLERQIACFKAAKRVVGVMGAAMTNIAFSQPGAEVFCLAPAGMPDTFFWFISGLRGLQFNDVRCEQVLPVRGPAPWETDLLFSAKDRELILGKFSVAEDAPRKGPFQNDLSATVTILPDFKGIHYLKFLKTLHEKLGPRTYLEIGTHSGDSLALANCASIAVDPHFSISSNVVGQKPLCLLFQGTSDDYFASQEPERLLGRPIDFAFIDGLHLFEVLLRDFMNAERNCCPHSLIAIHDCMPTDIYMAERTDDPIRRREMGSKPNWWTGDVWKIVPILTQWRPEVTMISLDCWPTGLLLLANLNPESRVLDDNYQLIVDQFARLDLASYGLERFHALVGTQDAASVRLPLQPWNSDWGHSLERRLGCE